MSEILLIGEPEIVEGFALTGARVEAERDPERVRWRVDQLLRSRDPGIVVITESLYEGIAERTRLRAEVSARPLFVTLPRPAGMEFWEGREDLISRIIRRAIGYRLRIRR